MEYLFFFCWKPEAHQAPWSMEELCTLFVSNPLFIDPGRAQKVMEVAVSLSRCLSGLLSLRAAALYAHTIATWITQGRVTLPE
jgi:hypothetical protein